jgi:hypothetical protein
MSDLVFYADDALVVDDVYVPLIVYPVYGV